MRNLCLSALLLLFVAQQSALAQNVEEVIRAKPVNLNGTLGVGLGTYHVNGIPARQRAFSYIFNGSPTLSIYGLSFPFTVVLSDQQRSYTQPFNQYGISPTYKWITVHAGWRSLEFSPYTLAGHNFLGGGVELNPGKLRLGFVYGRFNKAIEEDLSQPLALAQQPAYKRTGYSAKIGYGSARNHFDIIMLNAKDDVNSLTKAPTVMQITPAENLVLGLSSKFSFLRHFVFDMDVAGSIYTRNVLSDTIGNIELGRVAFIKKMVTLNTSTQLLTAAQGSIGYQAETYTVKFRYQRVDPDYKSMGAYYFETDVQNFTIEGMVRLFKSALQLSGSLGLQNDNLLHDKPVESIRKIGSINASFNKQSYGIDLRYANYGITQDRGLNPVIDMLRIARTNHNLSTMFRYNINRENITHGFILVANLQNLVDLNDYTAPMSRSNSKSGNFSYQLGLPKQNLGVNANINYTIADVATGRTVFYGPTLGGSTSFFETRLGLSTALSYQVQRNDHANAGNIFSAYLNGAYRLGKKDAANLSLNYIRSNATSATLPSFNEVRTNLSLVHSF